MAVSIDVVSSTISFDTFQLDIFENANLRFLGNFDEYLQVIDSDYIPDIVIVDTHEGDEADLDYLKRFISNPVLNALNYTIITDENDHVFEAKAFELGVSEVIQRPFDVDVFNKRIKKSNTSPIT